MSGDYSRVRFDPSMDISGVLMQQGRVQLDSDWNEWVAALDRRMRAESVDTFGVQPSVDKAGVAVVSPQTPDAFKIGIAVGPGLYGEYFDDINLTNCKLKRTDATINFDWKYGSPDSLIGADNFSVRWSGWVLAPVSGNYTFHTVSDDGVRLWVDNKLRIDNWTDHSATENNSGSIMLAEGQKYNIKLEYYERLGVASIQLLWTYPGQDRQIIPQGNLFPGITIGRGRMYVDGLLAENHGGGAAEFDSVLAELRGKDPLNYFNQPYFPHPPALPGSGTHLAYLEVWQREATCRQLPGILENAVGVDTTTRLQTVWQVRLLENKSGSADCATPDGQVPGWADIIAPSAARLTITTNGVTANPGPCELPPGGGYRGQENQLYRIEIHDGGDPDEATFKWSRENASVESNVAEIVSPTELKLTSLGRDLVLGFSNGDWVEILDDWRELGGENGDRTQRRGEMRRITVDRTKQTITFSDALPGELIKSGANLLDKDALKNRHTRVRRWDQKDSVLDSGGKVIFASDGAHHLITTKKATGVLPGSRAGMTQSHGVIPVKKAMGAPLVLENGIQVQFSLDPSGGKFHSGDYWVAAARTADGKVEELDQAPPRGIHRHYARLAMVTLPVSAGTETFPDCRTHWPPACGGCCTINVSPGESIQAAINLLGERGGGCVCLKTGVHNIDVGLHINSSNIVLRGESPGTIVRSAKKMSILQIGNGNNSVSDIVVEGLRFEVIGPINTVLYLDKCARVRIEHCEIICTGNSSDTVGIILDGEDISVVSNRLDNFDYGIQIVGYQGKLHIAGNTIERTNDDKSGESGESRGKFGIVFVPSSQFGTSTIGCHVQNNLIRHFSTGIRVGWNTAAGSIISGNRIYRSSHLIPGNDPKIDVQWLKEDYLTSCKFGIDIAAERCEVRNNYIDLRSAAWGGIRVLSSYVTVADNTLEAIPNKGQTGLIVPAGICCYLLEDEAPKYSDYAVIRGNRLLGPQSGIIILDADGVTISGNFVDGSGKYGWFGVLLHDCTASCIENNDLRKVYVAILADIGAENRIAGNRINLTSAGIVAWNAGSLEITGNTLQICYFIGMGLLVNGNTAVRHNRVQNCGLKGLFDLLYAGIVVISPDVVNGDASATVDIEGCEVIDTGILGTGLLMSVASGAVVGIAAWAATCKIVNNRVGYSSPVELGKEKEHRALLLIGPVNNLRSASGSGINMQGSALISANHFDGPGKTALVGVPAIPAPSMGGLFGFEKVIFSNNICKDIKAEGGATVHLAGGHLIVVDNHVKTERSSSMSLESVNVTLLGNVATGNFLISGSVKPVNYPDFNVVIS